MERSGVQFLPDDSRIGTRQLAEEDSLMYEARVYFKSFYGNDEATLKVKLDIKEYDQIFLPPQTRQLIHSYSDADLCRAEIQCHKLEELLASKLKALLQRNHSADLYDFVYACDINCVFCGGTFYFNHYVGGFGGFCNDRLGKVRAFLVEFEKRIFAVFTLYKKSVT